MEQKPTYYLRPSHKQLSYLDYLYNQAGEINKSLYSKFSMPMATREIRRLKNKVDRQKRKEQLSLF